VHDADEVPMMVERGSIVSPGFLTRIAVTALYVSKQTLLSNRINAVISGNSQNII